MKDQEDFHFFAASATEWRTTNDKVDLRQLLKAMDKSGYDYNLFRVPCKHDENYEIKWYQPQVKGSIWLGFYNTKMRKA